MGTSGSIDLTIGGKPIFPYIPQEILDTAQAYGRWENQLDGPQVWRRSLYVYRRRTLSFPFFETFDLPDQNITTASRNTSTVAPQALTLLNNPFVLGQAELFAKAVQERAPYDISQQVDLAYRTALTRPPSAEEAVIGRQLVEQGSLQDLTHVIFNLSEFPVPEVEPMSHSHQCGKKAKRYWSRREFLMQSGGGMAGLALASLLERDGVFAAEPGAAAAQCSAQLPGAFAARPPHFAPRATNVISLFMSGGVSHIDTFDHKPALARYAGQPLEDLIGEKFAVRQGMPGPLMPSPFTFKKHGQSGMEVSELFPIWPSMSMKWLLLSRSMVALTITSRLLTKCRLDKSAWVFPVWVAG